MSHVQLIYHDLPMKNGDGPVRKRLVYQLKHPGRPTEQDFDDDDASGARPWANDLWDEIRDFWSVDVGCIIPRIDI